MRRAERVLTRGVASVARLRTASPSVQMATAEGAVLTDLDGNEYVDLALGLGPVILGHRPPAVIEAVRASLESGVVFGAPHEGEGRLAELLVEVVPCAEMVSLCSTGSEAVHYAVRLARARTGRSRIVKFDGHYHGWIDPLFVNAPWAAAQAEDSAPAVHAVAGLAPPAEVTVARWNSLESLERALADGPPAAAVIMEPVPCNAGTFEPRPGYLEGARELCERAGAALIFDEVLTGFRLALGGAQERVGVLPDLVVLSKAISSGFPLAAIAGSREWMEPAVSGPVMPAGTSSGSPAAVAAAIATVTELRGREDLYPRLDRLGARLQDAIEAAAAATGAPLRVNRVGSVFQLTWGVEGPITEYADVASHDRRRVAELVAGLLPHGVHALERGLLLLCDAHTEEQVDAVGAAFEPVLAAVARKAGS
jgi:glutamate-1-semialdehyde 2,1-aminomutase